MTSTRVRTCNGASHKAVRLIPGCRIEGGSHLPAQVRYEGGDMVTWRHAIALHIVVYHGTRVVNGIKGDHNGETCRALSNRGSNPIHYST